MFRAIPKVFAATGLALALISLSLLTGTGSRTAEAIPVITLSNPGFAACGPTTLSASVIETSPAIPLPTTVTFASGQGTFSPNPASVFGGIATTSFTPFVFSGIATISATAAGPGGTGTSAPITLTISCGTGGFGFTGCIPSIPSTCVGFGTTCIPSIPSTCVGFGTTCIPSIPSTCVGFQNCAPAFGTFVTAGCFVANPCNAVGGGFFLGGCASATQVAANAITIQAPSSATCGSQVSISATLRNAFGLAVPSGTLVTFSSTLGQIQTSSPTSGAAAVSSLVIPTRVSGTAVVTVTSGSVSAIASIPISCPTAAAPAVAPVAAAPAVVVAAPVAAAPVRVVAPSTGDGGLLVEAD